MKLFYLWLAVLLTVFVGGCSENSTVDQKDISISGIDVSLHQGAIDFEKVYKDGIGYVFIRATDGVTYQDQNFHANYEKAKAAGLVVGAYHFYRNQDDPLEQLHNFTANTRLSVGDLAPVVDIEQLHKVSGGDFVKDLNTFLDGLEQHYKIKPIIYSGEHFANQHLSHFASHKLWLADYQVDQPVVPDGWSHWTFWQWSDVGRVDGITQVVDMSRFNHKKYNFQELLITDK